MIKKIKVSEEDIMNIDSCFFNMPKRNEENFIGVVVNKPWGYEYLMFQNHDLSIWLLFIKKGYTTSMHCHPNKKTSLCLLSGEAVTSTLNEKHNLQKKEGLIIERGVFHSTESLSEEGIFLIEIETPVNKTDLFRLKDRYNREKENYTKNEDIVFEIKKYPYYFIKDENCRTKIFEKYDVNIQEYSAIEDLLKDINLLKPDIGILLQGKASFDGEDIEVGDLIKSNWLDNLEFDSKIRILFLNL